MKSVFVGTMFSGEGDFKYCCDAIKKQRSVGVTHCVITDLSEIDAHNKLWESWNNVKHSYDLFIKVDADTVLSHNNIIANILSVFEANPDLTGLQAPLYDYYTDSMINGLNCFTKDVVFNVTSDKLFCDRNVDTNHKQVFKAKDLKKEWNITPAGFHCVNANEKQSFHYGVHRKLKNQDDIISLVNNAFQKHKDKNRAYCLLGAHFAQTLDKQHNYTDEAFTKAFTSTKKNFKNLCKNTLNVEVVDDY